MSSFTAVVLKAVNDLDEDCLGSKFKDVLREVRDHPLHRQTSATQLWEALNIGFQMEIVDGNQDSGVYWIPCNVPEEVLEEAGRTDALQPRED
jgi:hypothetical protein